MNEHNRSTRRICGILPDDPRLAACTLWLNTSTLTPATQDKVRAAIHEVIEESGEWATEELVPEDPDEVREPGVAEEVQGRSVREAPLVTPSVWRIWCNHYGTAGARRLCYASGLTPRE